MPVRIHLVRNGLGPDSSPTEVLKQLKSFLALSLICGPKVNLLSSQNASVREYKVLVPCM